MTSSPVSSHLSSSSSPSPRVVLVDDMPGYREGLRDLLEAEGIDIVGVASDGLDAIWAAGALRPDVMLMDLRMPRLDGVQATQRIKAQYPEIHIVVLTTFDDDELVFDALRYGAVGYLLKGTPGDEIASAIIKTGQGESVLTPAISRKVVSQFVRMAQLTPRESEQDFDLSKRELQVLRHLAQGSMNKEIAIDLGVAEGTIKNHLTRIFEKLDVTCRTTAALKAREHGII